MGRPFLFQATRLKNLANHRQMAVSVMRFGRDNGSGRR